MSLSTEQYFTLEQMGIPVWEYRQSNPVSTEDLSQEAEDLPAIDYAKTWVVIFDKKPSIIERRLITAIFGSINVAHTELVLLEQQQSHALKKFSPNKSVVLILGKKIAENLRVQPHSSLDCQQFENSLLTVIGPSLQEILENTQVKSEMWQSILKLRNLRVQQLD